MLKVVAPKSKEVTPKSQKPEEVITMELQELASDSKMVPDSLPRRARLYALIVISSMSTIKHGIMCTCEQDMLSLRSPPRIIQSAP